MYEKVAFTMYPVTDRKRARAFYEDTLGFTISTEYHDGMWTEIDLPGGGCLALFAGPQVEPFAKGASVAIEVSDLDALTEDLRAQGVTFLEELIESPVCRMSIIQDSEGNGLIFHQLRQKR